MKSTYTCIRLEGGLLSADIISQIEEELLPGQKPADFSLPKTARMTDEITSVWADAQKQWQVFQNRLQKISPEEPATSETRDLWIIPLFSLLGYRLTYQPRAIQIDAVSFPISHRAGETENTTPFHIVGYRQNLDRRPESGRTRFAPHSLLQEYLNRSEDLWGIVTNGKILRILRDSQLLRRQSYIEFDLESMMEGSHLSEFRILYRLLHNTRFPQKTAEANKCLLEYYHQTSKEQGTRIRDRLRDSVEEAIKIFANGFIQHPKSEKLREQVQNKQLSPQKFYEQLLHLIYRLLFLMVAEERTLISDNTAYNKYYSISRLRSLAEQFSAYNEQLDIWLSVKTTFSLFQREDLGKTFGIQPLNGDLFDPSRTENIETDTYITNKEFLEAFKCLSMYRENTVSAYRRINYGALDVEELGSVYESLLDSLPLFNTPSMEFILSQGTERKTTGSYYTAPELVNELIKSALNPVIEDKLSTVARGTDREKENALLDITVCDPACGSGHFLLAAARALGKELARIRSGADEPPPEELKTAIRDVIIHCIYGVDKNPLAVDLCKVALWLESHVKGKPLTFLDHKIRCGDSLVGVLNVDVLKKGIPDGAFSPVTGDDKTVATRLKKKNKDYLKTYDRKRSLPFSQQLLISDISEEYTVFKTPDDTIGQIKQKAEALKKLHQENNFYIKELNACNLWTTAFFATLTDEELKNSRISTSEDLDNYLDGSNPPDARLISYANALALKHKIFHWQLEFPDVFDKGGFDVVLCNPPWERIKLQEEEFFATRDNRIVQAANKSVRKKLIDNLKQENPELYQEYKNALKYAECLSKYLRQSERFPLTGKGDINTYSVFSENFLNLLNEKGRTGMVVPTGIATDDTNKEFFSSLVLNQKLVSLYDFENRERIFPSVDSRYKFSLLTMIRRKSDTNINFAFFLTNTNHIKDEQRTFTLTPDDFALFNPNTLTCPVFRTKADAELTRKIYKTIPVLINEQTGENPWGISFQRMFDMSNDSHLFKTEDTLEEQGFSLSGNRFIKGKDVFLPLYEAKMIWHYDHRFGSYEGVSSRSSTHVPTPSTERYANPEHIILPWYWVSEKEATQIVINHKWFLSFRNVTNITNERSAVFSVIPFSAVGNSSPVLLFNVSDNLRITCLTANLSTLIFDFIVRQKLAGMNMNFFYVQQLPVLSPDYYTKEHISFIIPRVLELIHTAWDIKAFADDVWKDADENLKTLIRKQWEDNKQSTGGHEWQPPDWAEIEPDGIPLSPFKWDENRRAQLRAELDAYYAILYGLTEEELRYILDPQDVYGSNFPGETFRVLKNKELKLYGTYRTKNLILQSFHSLTFETGGT